VRPVRESPKRDQEAPKIPRPRYLQVYPMKNLFSASLSLVLAVPATGQLPCQVQKLVSPNGSGTDFGSQVALHGTRAAIAAPFARVGQSPSAGVVWTYTIASGVLQTPAAISALDAASEDYFGRAISLWQDRLVVGATGDDDQGPNSGSAYVFEIESGVWTQKAKLLPPAGSSGTAHAFVVDIDGDVAIVTGNGQLMSPGYVHVHERTGGTWNYTTTLTAPQGNPADLFGLSAAVSGDTIAVGAPAHKVGVFGQAGAVYVYRRIGGTWSFEQEVTAAVPKFGASLGVSVTVSGDELLAGAHAEELGTGRVHVFTRAGTQWTATQLLQASDSHGADFFGIEIALDGDRAWISSNGNTDVPGVKFAAYEFRRSGGTWQQSTKLEPLDPPFPYYPGFGRRLALSGGFALASSQTGAPPSTPTPDEEAFLFATSGFGCAQIAAAPSGVSLLIGGTQDMTLSLPAFAGKPYLVVGSSSWIPGVSAGTPVDGLLVPLTVDSWTLFTLQNANQPPMFSATLGVLDAHGNAQPKLKFPNTLPGSLVGITLHHAALVLEPSIPQVVASTGAVGWKLYP
jgi:FG-GAP repeat